MKKRKRKALQLTGISAFLMSGTENDKRTYSFMLTYELIRKERAGLNYYRVIPRSVDPRNHNSWTHLDRARALCDENQFDYEEFIIAQFVELVNWKLPFVNMLHTEGALDRYHNFRARWLRRQQIHEKRRRGGKVKEIETGTEEYFNEQVDSYLQRGMMLGVNFDRAEYIIYMVNTGMFPEWYATKRVPGWRKKSKGLGFNGGVNETG